MSTLFGKSQRKRRRVMEQNNNYDDDDNDNDNVKKNDGNENNTKVTMSNEAPSTTSLSLKQQPLSGDTLHSRAPVSFASWCTFADLGLADPLVQTCRAMGFRHPTPVQRTMIPFLLSSSSSNSESESNSNVLCLAATGSGKTAAFVLPMLQHLQADPYGIFAVVVTPTRELAKQIHQQILALGTSAYRVQSVLVVGGMDSVKQSCQLQARPHFVVATPGRLAELLKGPSPPKLSQLRYMVLDEADRLLCAGNSGSGFERHVAEILLHAQPQQAKQTTGNVGGRRTTRCQTLLFSATMTKSLSEMEQIAGAGQGRCTLKKFVIRSDDKDGEDAKSSLSKTKKAKLEADEADATSNQNDESEEEEEPSSSTPTIPTGLKQEYIFMPSRVRNAYLLTAIRALLINGGRRSKSKADRKGASTKRRHTFDEKDDDEDDHNDDASNNKARSAIIFVATCEDCALLSGILHQLGVDNVALHSLLDQNRRLASLAKFQSQQVRLMIATDVASRGLDIPSVDLILNATLPRTASIYIHRVGRTARAGRRGRAISLVGESDVTLLQAAEQLSGRPLTKCTDVTDEMALKLLGPVTKASRLAKMKLMEFGFDELVQKMKERKARDRKERQRMERKLKNI